MSELTSEKLARRYRAEGNIPAAERMESLSRCVHADLELQPFTAVADCPDCGTVAIHWLEPPRHYPTGDSPVEKMQRRTAVMFGRRYDPHGSQVARVCVNCGWRWGQS